MKFGAMGEIEFASPDEIRTLQDRLLGEHMDYISARSPFYRRILSGSPPKSGKSNLERLRELPFTDKSAFEDHNDELLCVSMDAVADIVLSSGTVGRPTRVMYTEADLARLAYNERISFASSGLGAQDVVLLTCTMDRCFIAGLAYFLGVRALGAATIRNGLSGIESHSGIIERLRPTAIVGVPSFMLKLGLYIDSLGKTQSKQSVSRLFCIGEPIRDTNLLPSPLGARLMDVWGAEVFSTYASSETITTFCECSAGRGGHLHPELAVVEIVDDSGNVLPDGEVGEVVVTPLQIEGMPLLRFKTGDMSFILDAGRCGCGRNSPRLGPIVGRKKQMIKYRGTTLYPNAIFSVLDGISGVGEYYMAVSSDFDLSDVVEVFVSAADGARIDAGQIKSRLQAQLRVSPEIRIIGDDDMRSRLYAGGSRKPIRFLDMRRRG